jgi:hypothetical protein
LIALALIALALIAQALIAAGDDMLAANNSGAPSPYRYNEDGPPKDWPNGWHHDPARASRSLSELARE